jgi:hypothetical protein
LHGTLVLVVELLLVELLVELLLVLLVELLLVELLVELVLVERLSPGGPEWQWLVSP